MIDHITIEVSDLAKSKLFYEKAFSPLSYSLAFGKEGVFWPSGLCGCFVLDPDGTTSRR
ncbi:hypothetical protein MJ8_36080 [Mesorhizobium sp. J8]|nr:hypothetical protein MJ8_36080 [Mesorhizobium sp. J8]